MLLIMKITSKGQVIIPVEIREKLGFLPNTEVEFEVVEDALYLKKVAIEPLTGKKLISMMQGKATVKITTKEIILLTREYTSKYAS
jgi:AbrB family looped-hinge helix DNA binding protein